MGQTKPAEQSFCIGEMEAALCLWEAMLDLRAKLPALDAHWGNCGAWEMRSAVIAMTAHCEDAWKAFTNNGEDDTVTFDWEFCPAYIAVWVGAEFEKLPVPECVDRLRKELTPCQS